MCIWYGYLQAYCVVGAGEGQRSEGEDCNVIDQVIKEGIKTVQQAIELDILEVKDILGEVKVVAQFEFDRNDI